jgi:hypothetical protein
MVNKRIEIVIIYSLDYIYTNLKKKSPTNFTFTQALKNLIKHISIIALLVACITCDTNSREIKLKNDNWKKFKTIRLDQVLTNSKNIEDIHLQFIKYPQLYYNFYTNMIRAGKKEDVLVTNLSDSVKLNLETFINDSIIRSFLIEIQEEFPDFENYMIEIAKGLNRCESIFKYRYPKREIGTFFSLFNADVHEFDSIIWIGLDMYLGADNKITKLIPNESLPQYIKDKMDKKYIVSDVLFGHLMTHHYQYLGDDFLSKAIAYGKITYLMELILPHQQKENKFRYSKKELDWCQKNEKYIWQYIVDQELLYEKDAKKISYFFNPGPFTKNFGKDSPSNIGIWLGSRIIEDYAKNSDLRIQEILKEKNIQKLLSSYDPK